MVAHPCTTHCGLQYTLATGVEVNVLLFECALLHAGVNPMITIEATVWMLMSRLALKYRAELIPL